MGKFLGASGGVIKKKKRKKRKEKQKAGLMRDFSKLLFKIRANIKPNRSQTDRATVAGGFGGGGCKTRLFPERGGRVT